MKIHCSAYDQIHFILIWPIRFLVAHFETPQRSRSWWLGLFQLTCCQSFCTPGWWHLATTWITEYRYLYPLSLQLYYLRLFTSLSRQQKQDERKTPGVCEHGCVFMGVCLLHFHCIQKPIHNFSLGERDRAAYTVFKANLTAFTQHTLTYSTLFNFNKMFSQHHDLFGWSHTCWRRNVHG